MHRVRNHFVRPIWAPVDTNYCYFVYLPDCRFYSEPFVAVGVEAADDAAKFIGLSQIQTELDIKSRRLHPYFISRRIISNLRFFNAKP